MGSAAAAVAAAGIVVVATPDRAFTALPALCFAGGKVVLDCWGVLAADVADVAEVVRLGRGRK